MLVYMLLNTITEKAYVGQTTGTLEERVRNHWHQAGSGSTSQVHDAFREWHDRCFWEAIVLQHCYDQDELDKAEAAWQHICMTHDPAIGYNARKEKLTRQRPQAQQGDSLRTTRKASPIAGMSPEEAREFYREQGKKGAASGRKGAKPKAEMTEADRERYREWGRKGAARSKELAGKA